MVALAYIEAAALGTLGPHDDGKAKWVPAALPGSRGVGTLGWICQLPVRNVKMCNGPARPDTARARARHGPLRHGPAWPACRRAVPTQDTVPS